MPSSSQTTDQWRITDQTSEKPCVKSNGYKACLDDPGTLDDSFTAKIAAEWRVIHVAELNDHPGQQDRRSALIRCGRPSPRSITGSAKPIAASATPRFIQEL